jgi:hypothetical protein
VAVKGVKPHSLGRPHLVDDHPEVLCHVHINIDNDNDDNRWHCKHRQSKKMIAYMKIAHRFYVPARE